MFPLWIRTRWFELLLFAALAITVWYLLSLTS